MDPAGRAVVSVVLSFRNEAGNIPTLIARLEAMFAAQPADYEIVFVNDASTDASLATLVQQRERNPRVKVLNMTRPFGVAECLLAGLRAASGDAVVYMDADLQDPPETIPAMLDRWRSGADVVHTVRTRRHGESAFKTWATRLAYRIIRAGSTIDLPVDAGDFKLLSRRALEQLLRFRETDPYLRGLVVWLGFTQAFVPYERAPRHAGQSHFPFFSRNPWKVLVGGVTSFSFLPVYACLALAGGGLVASAVMLAAGSAFLALLTFFWATILAAIGSVGVYAVRTYKDVRGRPQYIVESSIGFPCQSADDR